LPYLAWAQRAPGGRPPPPLLWKSNGSAFIRWQTINGRGQLLLPLQKLGRSPLFLFIFIIDLKTESAGTAREDKRERRRRRTGKFHENLCRHTSPAEKTKKENKKKNLPTATGQEDEDFSFSFFSIGSVRLRLVVAAAVGATDARRHSRWLSSTGRLEAIKEP
jgi:hypothetical protein